MYIIFLYVCLLLITIITFKLINILSTWISIKKRMLIFDHYEDILLIFEQAKLIAYKKIWQEEIAIESISGFKVNPLKLKLIQNKYVKLVNEFCGPSVMSDLKEIHGTVDSLVLFLISGFITKLNEDEMILRQHIVDGGIDEEGEGKMFIDRLIGPDMSTGS